MSEITEGEANWKEEQRRILASEERYRENDFSDALIEDMELPDLSEKEKTIIQENGLKFNSFKGYWYDPKEPIDTKNSPFTPVSLEDFEKTESELFGNDGEKTLPMAASVQPAKSSSEIFLESIGAMQQSEISILNNRIASFMGCNAFTVEDLPKTMEIINKTYQYFEEKYKETGFVDFNQIQTGFLTGVPEKNLYQYFDKEVYKYFEEHFLTKQEIKKLCELVPESNQRQEMFVKYLRGEPITLPQNNNEKDIGIIKGLFRKIIQGFFRLMEHKNDLEIVFDNIKNSRGLPEVFKPTGTKIQGVQHVRNLDLRKSHLYSLGDLKTVSGDIHLDSDCKVPRQSWSNIDVNGKIFVNGQDKTDFYKNITQRKPDDKSILFPGMER